MGYKPVSEKQAMLVRKMANDKKVGCDVFQEAVEDGRLGRFLERLNVKVGRSSLIHPVNGRLCEIRVTNGSKEQMIILLNYPESGGGWHEAKDWAQLHGLKAVSKNTELDLIGCQHHDLCGLLKLDVMYILETVQTFKGSLVWYLRMDEEESELENGLLEDLPNQNVWYAFCK
jgi:hypothetical protein